MARLYVPLDVEFATDPKILEAGHTAAYLYICSLAYCKRASDNEGQIHRAQLRVLTLGLPGKPEKLAQTLVDVGLWEPTLDGWQIPAWLKHNLSAAQLAQRKADQLAKSIRGNHIRHHVEKNATAADCPLCYPPDTSPQGQNPLPAGTKKSPEGKEKGEGERREREREGKEKGSASSSSHNPNPVTTPAADDDDGMLRIEFLIEQIARTRTKANSPTRNPDGYLRTVIEQIERTELEAIRQFAATREGYPTEVLATFYEAQRVRSA